MAIPASLPVRCRIPDTMTEAGFPVCVLLYAVAASVPRGDKEGAMPHPMPDLHQRELRFVGRMYRMRMLGLGLGVLPIASVLHDHGASWPVWCLLVINGYLWPQLAYLRARRSRDPRTAEFNNLIADSALGGMWIAVMHFNLLPSALLVTMLSVDKIGVAGWRFLARTASVQVAVCLLAWTALGFPLQLQSSMANIVSALPFMFAYPMAISTLTFHLGHRVAQQNRQLERLNRIDVLTGLPNRRHWEEIVGSELARYLRTRRPAVLLLIDVDRFKEVNDNHGHVVGDEVLRNVATALRTSIREIATAARYGGDEFATLLAETDARGAQDVAERIRNAFLAKRGAAAEQEQCTLSIGIAEADRLLVTVDDWIRRADAAMYRAKAAGRDRIGLA
jgi:diguanylate cyclase